VFSNTITDLRHGSPNRRERALDHIPRGARLVSSRVARAFADARPPGARRAYLIVRGSSAESGHPRALSRERDALQPAPTSIATEADKHSARVFAQTFDAELRRLGLGTLEPSDWLASPGPQWPVDPTVGNHPIAGYHQMGTTRMSADPAHGVVSADCNVRYDNLFIAGSSRPAPAVGPIRADLVASRGSPITSIQAQVLPPRQRRWGAGVTRWVQ
jgi:choline dehydrogenase-like flavoprotein